MDIHAIDWNQTPWERVREGVERKAFSGDGATVSLNRLQPGHEPRPHDHPHEQIVYIVSGHGQFTVGDREPVSSLAMTGPRSNRHYPGSNRTTPRSSMATGSH